VNGELDDPEFDAAFRAHGIRQMIYTSTEGEERLFPDYYLLPSSARLHPRRGDEGDGQRVEGMVDLISRSSQSGPAAGKAAEADLMGAFVAGWADAGLHPETFWLGYATGPAAAWNRNSPGPPELMNTFFPLFYGQHITEMGRLYQLMSEQAQFWQDSWETGPSHARTPIFGDSNRVYQPPRPADDQFLPALPLPSTETLQLNSDWRRENNRRLELAGEHLAQNDQLLDLLHENLQRAEFNRYNLQVFLSVANIYRQNLQMLHDLGRVDEELKLAEAAASKSDAVAAVEAIDRALDLTQSIRQQRNRTLDEATATWYQSWFPRVKEANGRIFLDQVDDVKDHVPIRTVDMSYLVYRELQYPLDDWARQVMDARNTYAQKHGLPLRKFQLDWKDTSRTPPAP
jgi:hypothetical protein